MTAENQFLRGQNPLLPELELTSSRVARNTPHWPQKKGPLRRRPSGPAAAAGQIRRGRYAVAQYVAASQAAASRVASADAAAPCQLDGAAPHKKHRQR